ncbi:hypothetical protein EVJ58_g4612 [Rhodofomes roseus]|uniref:Uncharacterized protein n=1 Tax=Rhodofomes roseus TaxID=34475 RepID=A0A4Y9YH01_9APHY|nr:hypothetical protein EVJ58_g4612 [Rhodofomes roseus]
MFILDMLDNMPRLRLSTDHLKLFIWALNELSVPDVPSFKKFREMQDRLTKLTKIRTSLQRSATGEPFYQNSVPDLLALDWANPEISRAPWLHAVSVHATAPDEAHLTGPNPLRETLKGRRMYTSFIKAWGDDVSGNRSKQYNEHTNIYFAHANIPHEKLSQEYFVQFASTSPSATAIDQFSTLLKETEGWHLAYDCELGEEIMIRIEPLVFPADNPQQSELCSHIGLKGNSWCRKCMLGGTDAERETDEMYHQHFSPSRLRTAVETRAAVIAQLKLAALGVAKDVEDLQTKTGVKDKLAEHWIQILLQRAKQEQQLRLHNRATRDPRLNRRNVPDRAAIVRSIKDAIQEEILDWVIREPQDDYEALSPDSPWRTTFRPGIHYNSLLLLNAAGDIHADTPVEILHTYLLGADKYAWHHLHTSWKPAQHELFATRLRSASIDGLNIPPIRAAYIVQYKNGLIGKHFKALQQVGVFQLDDALCDSRVFDLWRATGELGAMLWFEEIENMDVYLVNKIYSLSLNGMLVDQSRLFHQSDLEILIANVLDIWSLIDPKRIFVKPKLHTLPHILDDVRLHGPLIFVLSNHQAPSRDIAWTFADLGRFKHAVSGGWWKDEKGRHVRAGDKVRQYFHNSEVQRRLGYLSRSIAAPGTVRCKKKNQKRGKELLWRDLRYFETATSDSLAFEPQSLWYCSTSVMSQHQDRCVEDSWVFCNTRGRTLVGRIAKILTAARGQPHGHKEIVVVENFQLPNSCHPRFNMPELTRADESHTYTVLLPSDVMFIINVQHNCLDGKCAPTGTRRCVRERIETEMTQTYIEHTTSLSVKVTLF